MRTAKLRLMRIVSADEAVSGIKSGQQIFMHGSAATPSVLLDALCRRAPELQDVKIVHMHGEGPTRISRPTWRPLLHRALFIGPNARNAINDGRAEFIPVFLPTSRSCSTAACCRSTPSS